MFAGKKMKWIILLIISTVLTLIYGSRGPLVSVLWYFLLYLFLSREKFDLKKAVLILGSTLLISILIYFDILCTGIFLPSPILQND